MSASRVIEMKIPRWHPTRLNELTGNRFKATRLKAADRQVVAAYYMPYPAAETKRRVTLTIFLKPKCRGADSDAYHKSLCDALVACDALVDDRHQWVELAPVEFGRASDWWGCTIRLEDV